jgi:hypothetical protein
MGVDFQTASFIAYCTKKMGVDLSRTLVLGRQHLFMSADEARFLLRQYGYVPSEADIERMTSQKFADDLLTFIGCRDLEFLDFSDFEGANVIHDLNDPIDHRHQGKYTAVIDGGTIEHVFDVAKVMDNCMKLCAVGGHFLSITAGNNYLGHGFYQFSPELFFNVFCEKNGFKTIKVFLAERFNKEWYEIPDPALLKKRVQLVNGERTFIMTLAQRISEQAGILVVPQQGHYELNWEARDNLDFGKGGKLSKYKNQITRNVGSVLGIDALHMAQRLYAHRTFRRMFNRNCPKINPMQQ